MKRFGQLADQTGQTVRIWHALLFRCLLADLEGDRQQASRLADEARDLGRRSGIAEAEIVRLAQGYFQLRSSGRVGDLAPFLDAVPRPDADNRLFRAAKADILHAAGRVDEAGEEARRLADEVLAMRTATTVQCLGLLLPVIVDTGTTDLRERVLRVLDPFLSGGLVIGAGIGFIPSLAVDVDT